MATLANYAPFTYPEILSVLAVDRMEKDVPVDKLHLIRENLATTEDEETDDDDSTFAFIYRQFRDFFIDNIPVEIVKQLPNYGK